MADLLHQTRLRLVVEENYPVLNNLRLGFLVAALTFVVLLQGANAQDTSLFQIRGASPSGSFLAGQQAIRELRPEDAARFFMDAAEVEWDNPAIVQQAFGALIADGRVEDAAALAQHLVEIQPENEMARLVLGTVALKQRRYPSAVSQLENIGDINFIGLSARILQSWALIGEKSPAEAEAIMTELADAGLAEFLSFHRALMADVIGEREKALDLAEQAYEVEPYVLNTAEAYARMLGNASRFDDARNVVSDYLAEGADHPIMREILVEIEAGRRPGKMAGTVQQGAAELFHGFGSALARDGSSDMALIFTRLALFLNPGDDVTSMSLASIYESGGRYDYANNLYNSIPKSSPLYLAAIIKAAENLDSMGDREEAIRRLSNITSANPEEASALGILGDLYRFDEQYEEAIDAYTKTLAVLGEERPRDWYYFYLRGIAYERAGVWSSAEADFKKALELNPGQPQVLNYLGYSWVDKGMNLTEALEMIREAVNARPMDGYIVDSLGWAYFKLGRIEDAVKTLEQAVRLQPNDPEINDHLGDAYWKAGRKIEARFQWNIAVSVDDSERVAERASLKLANGLDGAGE